MAPRTLQEAIIYFSDEDVCREFVAKMRWPDGIACPRCGSLDVSWLEKQERWQCKARHQSRQFSIKTGTIFEDSPLPLSKWLPSAWLIASAKNGISSHELARAMGFTQKTAWFVLQRLRLAMQEGGFEPFRGEVEVDETFIGGKARNMHFWQRQERFKGKRGGVGKAAVMGVLERHGPDGHSRIRTEVVRNTRRSSLAPVIQVNVETGATVYSDGKGSYERLNEEYIHEAVNHDAEEYVRDAVHTNGIENFWALLKRSIGGTYVSVEPFHLFRYLDEQAYRFNNRKATDGDRFAGVIGNVTGRRLTYTALTGADSPD
jgi:hypothetical protein